MSFYPPKYMAQWLGLGLDGFVAVALVIAGSGSGALALAVTRDRLAASFAAAVTPALGFFGAHISHTSIIHAVCWAPLMILAGWGLSRASARRAPWAGLLGLSLGFSLLAGHPQLSLYALAATVVIAVPQQMRSLREWVGVSLWGTLGTAIGIAIALPQLVPSMEFASFSGRAVMESNFLSQFSASPGSLLLNVFPFIFGGNWIQGSEVPYLGVGSWNEVVAAIGVTLLAVAAIGASRTSLRTDWWRFALLGFGAAILSVLPSSEAAAKMLVDVPVFGQFRAWARWLSITSLCLVQMAAIAIASMRSTEGVNSRSWLRSLAVVVLTTWVSAIMLTMRQTDASPMDVLLSSPTWVQLVACVACLAALSVACSGSRKWLFGAAIATTALLPVVELAYLSRSMAWATNLMPTDGESSRADIEKVQALTSDGSRLASMSGWQSPNLSPDYSRINRIPSINWYGPLLDQRFAQLTGLTTGGWTRGEVLSDANQSLDIYGVSVVETYAGFSYGAAGERITPVTADGVRLGPGCNEANPASVDIRFASELQLSQIEFYTSLACSLSVMQGEQVATISANPGGQTRSDLPLVAGGNTADWGHSCIADRPAGMHTNPGAVAQVPLADPGAGCAGSVFFSVLEAKPAEGDIESIRIAYSAPTGGLVVHGASLTLNGKRYPAGPSLVNALSGPRWKIVGVTDGGALLISNRRVLPRFRFVGNAVNLEDEQTLAAIQKSRLPDGSAFDAKVTAILEPSASVPARMAFAAGPITDVVQKGTSSFVVTFPPRITPALLVFGDNYNRRWRASSSGARLDVLRTNYNQMSVLVPQAATQIRFDYVDEELYGAGIAATVSLLLGLILLLGGGLQAGRRTMASP